jgi:hypothetical protein
MDENDLTINITAIDDASETLNEVATTASDMGDSVAEAANVIADSFEQTDAQLQDLVDASFEAAQSWMGSMDSMAQSTADAVVAMSDETEGAGTTLAENIYGPMDTAGTEMLASLQEQGAALEEAIGQLGTMSAEAWEESFGTLIGSEMAVDGDTAGAAFGGGFMSTFRYLMLGYFANTFGSDIIGAVTGAVSAAAGRPDAIAALQAQIQSEQATIQTGEAALTKWNGTTVEVAAAHDKARASIEAATVKIAQLQLQLAPLQAAYQGAAGTTNAYDTATLKLGADWQGLQGTIGGTILPTLTQYSSTLDGIVLATTAWVQQNPALVEQLLEFSATFGEMIKLLGDALIGYALWSIALKILGPDLLVVGQYLGIIDAEVTTMTGGSLLLMAAVILAIAAAVAALIVYWPQIQQFLDYWGEKTGAFQLLNTLWTELGSIWENIVMPALKELWTQLQPLMPYLKLGAEIIGGVLLAALLIVVVAIALLAAGVLLLVAAWAMLVSDLIKKVKPVFDDLVTWAKPFTDWISTLPSAVETAINDAVKFFQPIINAVQSLINLIKEIPSGILPGIGSGIAGAASSILPGIGSGIAGAASSILSGIGSGIAGAASSILPGGSLISSLLGGILGLAAGGIVNSPTLALVGEAGPEAIIPLSAFNGGGSLAGSGSSGSGGNIIVNITGTFLSQDAARQVGDMLVKQVQRNIRLTAMI